MVCRDRTVKKFLEKNAITLAVAAVCQSAAPSRGRSARATTKMPAS